MGFIECVFRKLDHFVEYLVCHIFGNAVSDRTGKFHCSVGCKFAVNEIFTFLLHDVHLFLTHCSTHDVGAPE